MKTENNIPKWMKELWAWADENNISEEKLPRDKDILLQITELNLSDCQLTELPESIGQLSALKILDLSNNLFDMLPESINQLSQLEKFYFRENNVLDISYVIQDLPTQLKELDLRNNRLTTYESISLVTFGFLKNRLTKFPENISQLSKFEPVFKEYYLIQLPECISRLSELEKLNISYCELAVLPNSIGQLSKLKELNLSGNELFELPESIGNLSQLKNLDLWSNYLTDLPKTISKLEQLEEFNIMANEFEDVSQVLENLPIQLKEYYLEWHQLIQLLDDTFDNRNMLQLTQKHLSYRSMLKVKKKYLGDRDKFKLPTSINECIKTLPLLRKFYSLLIGEDNTEDKIKDK
ncbi:MAG: hypothetical protein KGV46_02390 [Pasteurella sp.]|nr:hypothetical protein [Pasteurella sp.]